MENKFKAAIWRDFWEKHNLLSEDPAIVANAEALGADLIDMAVKEVIGKVPHNKMAPSDRMRIRTLEIDFCVGTTVRLNKHHSYRPVVSITNLNLFSSFINVEEIKISYLNLSNSINSEEELILEGDLHNTKLFKHFPRLKKIVLSESCKDGVREVEFMR